MKRFLAVAAFASIAAATPVIGQQVQQQAKTIAFPAFTNDQNWARATTLQYSLGVGGYAFAKSRSVSPAEYGRWIGGVYAPGWGARDAGSAIRYARSIQNNLRAMSGMNVDVLNVNDTMIVMRTTRPWVSYFGSTKQVYGVTLDEYDAVLVAFQEEVGRHLGLRYQQRSDSASTTITITGRGKNAVINFPQGTYTVAFTAQDAGTNTMLVGNWEATYGANGKYTLMHDGQPFIQADYELSFDEVVFKNETSSAGAACSGPGRYRWTANPTNGSLGLGRLSDDCTNRLAFLTRKAFSKKG